MSVIVATPLCIKPAKDGLEDLLFPKKEDDKSAFSSISDAPLGINNDNPAGYPLLLPQTGGPSPASERKDLIKHVVLVVSNNTYYTTVMLTYSSHRLFRRRYWYHLKEYAGYYQDYGIKFLQHSISTFLVSGLTFLDCLHHATNVLHKASKELQALGPQTYLLDYASGIYLVHYLEHVLECP